MSTKGEVSSATPSLHVPLRAPTARAQSAPEISGREREDIERSAIAAIVWIAAWPKRWRRQAGRSFSRPLAGRLVLLRATWPKHRAMPREAASPQVVLAFSVGVDRGMLSTREEVANLIFLSDARVVGGSMRHSHSRLRAESHPPPRSPSMPIAAFRFAIMWGVELEKSCKTEDVIPLFKVCVCVHVLEAPYPIHPLTPRSVPRTLEAASHCSVTSPSSPLSCAGARTTSDPTGHRATALRRSDLHGRVACGPRLGAPGSTSYEGLGRCTCPTEEAQGHVCLALCKNLAHTRCTCEAESLVWGRPSPRIGNRSSSLWAHP